MPHTSKIKRIVHKRDIGGRKFSYGNRDKNESDIKKYMQGSSGNTNTELRGVVRLDFRVTRDFSDTDDTIS